MCQFVGISRIMVGFLSCFFSLGARPTHYVQTDIFIYLDIRFEKPDLYIFLKFEFIFSLTHYYNAFVWVKEIMIIYLSTGTTERSIEEFRTEKSKEDTSGRRWLTNC